MANKYVAALASTAQIGITHTEAEGVVNQLYQLTDTLDNIVRQIGQTEQQFASAVDGGLEQLYFTFANQLRYEVILALQAISEEIPSLRQYLDYMRGGSDGGSSSKLDSSTAGFPGKRTEEYSKVSSLDFDFPNSRFPPQTEMLSDYLGGVISPDEAAIAAAPPDPLLRNFFKAEGELFEVDIVNQTWGDSSTIDLITGENINVQASTLTAEADLQLKGTIDEDSINVGVSGSAGGYFVRVEGSAEILGMEAVGDAYIGATASGDAEFVIDPTKGDVKFVAKGEAFFGAEARGNVTYENEFFTVELQGSAGVGIGGRGHIEAGIDGEFLNIDASFLGTFGVGGGAGIKATVNLPETANFIVGQGINGVENMFGEVQNLLGIELPF